MLAKLFVCRCLAALSKSLKSLCIQNADKLTFLTNEILTFLDRIWIQIQSLQAS